MKSTIKKYCEYQVKHCTDMIQTLKDQRYKIKTSNLVKEMRDLKNIYKGRLSAVTKILELLEEK